jgi:hypothetical protein
VISEAEMSFLVGLFLGLAIVGAAVVLINHAKKKEKS